MSDLIERLRLGVHCPYCGETERLEVTGTQTTLVGWSMVPEEDPNHWTSGVHCEACGKDFYKHWVVSKQAVWYTGPYSTPDGQRCLEGTPACCEECYALPCTQPGCQGWMVHTGRGSVAFHQVNGRSVSQFPMLRRCDQCGHEERDPKYLTAEEAEALPPLPPPGPINFQVWEEPGTAYVNLAGIKKLRLD